MTQLLRPRQRFGKYRIERKLGEGGFATVYRARDLYEGVKIALKLPHTDTNGDELERTLLSEVRLASRLHHPNILSIKNADRYEGRLFIAYELGEETLADRLTRRMSVDTSLRYARQLLAALAHAHERRILHCDVKPENMIITAEGDLCLTDFGIARVALRTLDASGSGTLGYMAPEQAMGKPSFRSDVFAAALVIYRMLSGSLPEWPFDWPTVGLDRLRKRVTPETIAVLRRALSVRPEKRYRDGAAFGRAFEAARARKTRARSSRRTRRSGPSSAVSRNGRDWKSVRRREFVRRYGKWLRARHACTRCSGPVSEAMRWCPWCGVDRKKHTGETDLPRVCPRCSRGLKRDWRFCPWCFGAGFELDTDRRYSDRRYVARCSSPSCREKVLMPFMRYCPRCRAKVKRAWKLEGSSRRCKSCGCGVAAEYWSHCPWCGKRISRS